jgi:hypothetical protein
MKRIIAIFGVGLACAIAMISARAAAENDAEHQNWARSPLVVAQETQPTDADKKKLSEEIQKRYTLKPVPKGGSLPGGTNRMSAGSLEKCAELTKTVAAACATASAAACIKPCFPVIGSGPLGDECQSCVKKYMDKCTGCPGDLK